MAVSRAVSNARGARITHGRPGTRDLNALKIAVRRVVKQFVSGKLEPMTRVTYDMKGFSAYSQHKTLHIHVGFKEIEVEIVAVPSWEGMLRSLHITGGCNDTTPWYRDLVADLVAYCIRTLGIATRRCYQKANANESRPALTRMPRVSELRKATHDWTALSAPIVALRRGMHSDTVPKNYALSANYKLAMYMRDHALRAPTRPVAKTGVKYLYRGMRFPGNQRLGSQVRFESYTSWSTNPDIALEFAIPRHAGDRGIVFQLAVGRVAPRTPWVWFGSERNTHRGLMPSKFAEEDEVLLPPGTVRVIRAEPENKNDDAGLMHVSFRPDWKARSVGKYRANRAEILSRDVVEHQALHALKQGLRTPLAVWRLVKAYEKAAETKNLSNEQSLENRYAALQKQLGPKDKGLRNRLTRARSKFKLLVNQRNTENRYRALQKQLGSRENRMAAASARYKRLLRPGKG